MSNDTDLMGMFDISRAAGEAFGGLMKSETAHGVSNVEKMLLTDKNLGASKELMTEMSEEFDIVGAKAGRTEVGIVKDSAPEISVAWEQAGRLQKWIEERKMEKVVQVDLTQRGKAARLAPACAFKGGEISKDADFTLEEANKQMRKAGNIANTFRLKHEKELAKQGASKPDLSNMDKAPSKEAKAPSAELGPDYLAPESPTSL